MFTSLILCNIGQENRFVCACLKDTLSSPRFFPVGSPINIGYGRSAPLKRLPIPAHKKATALLARGQRNDGPC